MASIGVRAEVLGSADFLRTAVAVAPLCCATCAAIDPPDSLVHPGARAAATERRPDARLPPPRLGPTLRYGLKSTILVAFATLPLKLVPLKERALQKT